MGISPPAKVFLKNDTIHDRSSDTHRLSSSQTEYLFYNTCLPRRLFLLFEQLWLI